MLNKFLVALMIVMLIISPADCAKKRSSRQKSTSAAPAAPSGKNLIIGTWTGTGKGTGTDPRQPGAVIPMIAEDFIFTVEGFKSAGVDGGETADVIFMCKILDTRGNVKALRTWEYALPYDVKKDKDDSYIFSSEFLDGEDKITVTVTSKNTAKIRLQCADWNGDYADEISTFDITCDATKK